MTSTGLQLVVKVVLRANHEFQIDHFMGLHTVNSFREFAVLSQQRLMQPLFRSEFWVFPKLIPYNGGRRKRTSQKTMPASLSSKVEGRRQGQVEGEAWEGAWLLDVCLRRMLHPR